jgi:ankyrin repeat protein
MNMSKSNNISIIEAVINNDINEVKTILSKGVNVNEHDKIGFTALHYAAQNYLLEIATILLEGNAEVDSKDIHGNTPLFKAVFNSKGNGEMIKILLRFGANKDIKNNYGISPFELSKTIANYQITQFFQS